MCILTGYARCSTDKQGLAAQREILRTREGMAIAKVKGKLKGKQPKLSARQQAHLVELHEAGSTQW